MIIQTSVIYTDRTLGMRDRQGPILVVDDNKLEVLLIKKCLDKLSITQKVEHVTNGLEAMHYLDSGHRPSIILLDINMPEMNGLEFLEERSKRPEIQSIPVIILSSSDEQKDKESSLSLGACGYMIKPTEFDETTKMLKAILDYWTLSESVV